MQSAPNVELLPVTATNRDAVLALQLAADQQDYLASNAESLQEAKNDRDACPRAIMAEGRAVGFLMYETPKGDDEALIYRFMIDRNAQGRGYGRAALEALLQEIKTRRHVRSICVCYMPENEPARRLYKAFGFIEEGLDEDGEMFARLKLPAKDRRS